MELEPNCIYLVIPVARLRLLLDHVLTAGGAEAVGAGFPALGRRRLLAHHGLRHR